MTKGKYDLDTLKLLLRNAQSGVRLAEKNLLEAERQRPEMPGRVNSAKKWLADEILSIQKYTAEIENMPAEELPIDLAWAEINSLRLVFNDDWLRQEHYNEAVDDALEIIEKLGGRDPLTIK